MKQLLKSYNQADSAREEVINKSREVIKLSKKVITAGHNQQIKEAEKYAKEMESKVTSMRKAYKLAQTGAFSQSIQEYVEAILFLNYLKKKELTSYEKFNVTPDEYILGLCDFAGELLRHAVLQITRDDRQTIHEVYTTVNMIYTNLLDFSLRGEPRKKFDSLKYIINKLEDLRLELKLKA